MQQASLQVAGHASEGLQRSRQRRRQNVAAGVPGWGVALAAAICVTLLSGRLQSCDGARPPPPPIASQVVTAAGTTATAPDNSLGSDAIASLVQQVPPSPPPVPLSPTPPGRGRVAVDQVAGVGLTERVGSSRELAAALSNGTVSVIHFTRNITLSLSTWDPSGTVGVDRPVSLAPAPDAAPDTTLDFGRLPYVIIVGAGVRLSFSNLLLRGVASAAASVAAPQTLNATETFRVVGLPMWPSLGALPNSTVGLSNSDVYFSDNSGFVNCTLFQERVLVQYTNTYGEQFVNATDNAVFVAGRHVVSLPLLTDDGSIFNTGSVQLDTNDVTALCQLSNGGIYYGKPPPQRFPVWAGILIGVGLLLLFMVTLVAVLLLRRRNLMLRRDLEAARSSQQSSDGSKYVGNGTSCMSDKDQSGDLLAALWGGSSGNSSGGGGLGGSSGKSDEAVTLSQYHRQLLAMRAGSGLEGIEVGPILGRGSFGRVYKGRWNGALVAIKVIDASPVANAEAADSARESLLAASVSHPNVICTYKICTVKLGEGSTAGSGEVAVPPDMAGLLPASDDAAGSAATAVPVAEVPAADLDRHDAGLLETWMLLEYADRGSLEQAIRQKRFQRKASTQLDMGSVFKTLIDVATGMHYLHGLGIVHGDLKPANVLLKSTVTDSRGFNCKLADFGLSRLLDLNSTHVSTQSVGTVTYMPPELLSTGRLSKAVDAYSFGVLMWELYTGNTPYAGMAFGQVMFNVVHGGLRPEVPDCPPAYAALMRSCWAGNAGDRPAFAAIVADLSAQAKAVAAEAAARAAASKAAATSAAASVSAVAASSLAEGRRSAKSLQQSQQPGGPLAAEVVEAEVEAGSRKQGTLHSSLRDLRKVLSGRSFSLFGGGGSSKESSTRPVDRPSSVVVAAMRAAPRMHSISGEWVPRSASVSGATGAGAHNMRAHSSSGMHRKSASAAAGDGGELHNIGSTLQSIGSGRIATWGSGTLSSIPSGGSTHGSRGLPGDSGTGGGGEEGPNGGGVAGEVPAAAAAAEGARGPEQPQPAAEPAAAQRGSTRLSRGSA